LWRSFIESVSHRKRGERAMNAICALHNGSQATLLHCSKIAAQLRKHPFQKIKNSKLFQSITPVYSTLTS
jgi:hypothetical protein